MGHVTRNEVWGNVDLDTTTGRVFVQQDWHYTWLTWPGAAHWTHPEQAAFHSRADRAIWGAWSNQLYLTVAGRAPFSARRIPVTFDVHWKLHGASHYSVRAWKVPPGSTPTSPVRSEVLFGSYIQLSTADLMPRSAGNAAGQATSNFVTPPHEFGHTIGAPDEYNAPSATAPNAFLADTASIMNIGRHVRGRHLQLLSQALDAMVPGARFSA